jgi:hypothetical protein
MDESRVPPVIRSLFEAMNLHDADAAAAAVDPNVEILIGAHRISGVEVIRHFALQDDPALVVQNTAMSCREVDGKLQVAVHRITHWRESGDLSSEEDLIMSFRLTSDGLIGWARIA